MKLSVELPISLLELSTNLDYNFIIANHYRDFEIYRKFYYQKQDSISILDNGGFELGRSIDEKEYEIIIKELNPTIVVLPDVYRDKDATLKLSFDFLHKMIGGGQNLPYGFMGVLQGVTEQDFLQCFSFYAPSPHITHIGIPYHAFYRPKFLRDFSINELCSEHKKKIHILGLPNPFEICELKEFSCIESIDTCLPVVSGLQGLSFRKLAWRGRKGDMSSVATLEQTKIIIDNIDFLKSLCSSIQYPQNSH